MIAERSVITLAVLFVKFVLRIGIFGADGVPCGEQEANGQQG